MKITIDLPDVLFDEVKALALRKKTTMKAIVEDGLRRLLLDVNTAKHQAFKLENKRVGGGQMLIADPRDWRNLELNHIAARRLD